MENSPYQAIQVYVNRDGNGKGTHLSFGPLTHQFYGPDEILTHVPGELTVIANRIRPYIPLQPGDVIQIRAERTDRVAPYVAVATDKTAPTELLQAIAESDFPITAFPQPKKSPGWVLFAAKADIPAIERLSPVVTGPLPRRTTGELSLTGKVIGLSQLLARSQTRPIYQTPLTP